MSLLRPCLASVRSRSASKKTLAYIDDVIGFEAIIQLLTVFAGFLADYVDKQAIALTEHEPEAVASAKRFVHEHIAEPLSLGQVVSHVNVSRFYFCKLFKEATGITLMDYVTRVRIERVKTLLLDPSMRVSEVAFASGFGSIPRFNSAFKKHMGVSPSEYRQSVRSQLDSRNPGAGRIAI